MVDSDSLQNEAKEESTANPVAGADGTSEANPEVAALQGLEADIVAILQTIYDPEVPVDIYEMGLIYEVDVRKGGDVYLKMTLTSPMCPVAETLPPEVETKVRGVAGVSNVTLDLVWDPPWHPDMMSEAARLDLNM